MRGCRLNLTVFGLMVDFPRAIEGLMEDLDGDRIREASGDLDLALVSGLVRAGDMGLALRDLVLLSDFELGERVFLMVDSKFRRGFEEVGVVVGEYRVRGASIDIDLGNIGMERGGCGRRCL